MIRPSRKSLDQNVFLKARAKGIVRNEQSQRRPFSSCRSVFSFLVEAGQLAQSLSLGRGLAREVNACIMILARPFCDCSGWLLLYRAFSFVQCLALVKFCRRLATSRWPVYCLFLCTQATARTQRCSVLSFCCYYASLACQCATFRDREPTTRLASRSGSSCSATQQFTKRLRLLSCLSFAHPLHFSLLSTLSSFRVFSFCVYLLLYPAILPRLSVGHYLLS